MADLTTNLQRLSNARDNIANAITAKGGTVSSLDGFEDFPTDIATITNQYTASDEGKVVQNSALVAQTAHADITTNGTYDTTTNNSVIVNVSEGTTFKADTSFDYENNYKSLLETITIPNGVTTISNNCFASCGNLKSVSLPDTVTNIEYSAFHSCSSLTSVSLPDSLVSIGNITFQYCRSLVTIEIPSSVTTIGSNCFKNCSGLTTITIHKAQDSISGAPWGAPTSTQIVWTG